MPVLSSSPSTHLAQAMYRRRTETQDISHLSHEAQRELLSQALAARSNAVFLLRDITRGALEERLEGMDLLLTDLDGTTAKGPLMDEHALPLLRELREKHLLITALTGRPLDEMIPLFKNHDDDPGFQEAIIEAGAYLLEGDETEFLLSDPDIECRSEEARAGMRAILTDVTHAHGLSWQPMGFGGHKSSGAWHFMNGRERVSDRNKHDALMSDVRAAANADLRDVHVMSSTIGGVEIAMPGVIKSVALRAYARLRGIAIDRVMFAGDSGNDEDVFDMQDDHLKAAVFGAHTPQAIVERAHIATVGLNNVAPLLRMATDLRR